VIGILFIAGYILEPLKTGIELSMNRNGLINYVEAANEIAKILGAK